MAKVLKIRTETAICSIPLHLAVYCENGNTISNSRPYRCGVCGSEAVLRVEPILNREPDPPGHASLPIRFSLLRAPSWNGKRSMPRPRSPLLLH
jgi:hypothetical protein